MCLLHTLAVTTTPFLAPRWLLGLNAQCPASLRVAFMVFQPSSGRAWPCPPALTQPAWARLEKGLLTTCQYEGRVPGTVVWEACLELRS